MSPTKPDFFLVRLLALQAGSLVERLKDARLDYRAVMDDSAVREMTPGRAGNGGTSGTGVEVEFFVRKKDLPEGRRIVESLEKS